MNFVYFTVLQCFICVLNAWLYDVYNMRERKKLNFSIFEIFACAMRTHHIWLKKDQVIIFQGFFFEFSANVNRVLNWRSTQCERKRGKAKRRWEMSAVRACWKLKFIDRSTGTLDSLKKNMAKHSAMGKKWSGFYVNNSFLNKLTFEQWEREHICLLNSFVRFLVRSTNLKFFVFPNKHQYGIHLVKNVKKIHVSSMLCAVLLLLLFWLVTPHSFPS